MVFAIEDTSNNTYFNKISMKLRHKQPGLIAKIFAGVDILEKFDGDLKCKFIEDWRKLIGSKDFKNLWIIGGC